MPSTMPSNSRRRNTSRPTRNSALQPLLDDRGDQHRRRRRRPLPRAEHARRARAHALELISSAASAAKPGAPEEREQQQPRRLGLPAVDPQERGHDRADRQQRAQRADERPRPAPTLCSTRPTRDQPAERQHDQQRRPGASTPRRCADGAGVGRACPPWSRTWGAADVHRGDDHRPVSLRGRVSAVAPSASRAVRVVRRAAAVLQPQRRPPTSTSAQTSPTAAATLSRGRGDDVAGRGSV